MYRTLSVMLIYSRDMGLKWNLSLHNGTAELSVVSRLINNRREQQSGCHIMIEHMFFTYTVKVRCVEVRCVELSPYTNLYLSPPTYLLI